MRRSSNSEPPCHSPAAVHVFLACSHVTCNGHSQDMLGSSSTLCSSATAISVGRL